MSWTFRIMVVSVVILLSIEEEHFPCHYYPHLPNYSAVLLQNYFGVFLDFYKRVIVAVPGIFLGSTHPSNRFTIPI
jgi:hypothetical protein